MAMKESVFVNKELARFNGRMAKAAAAQALKYVSMGNGYRMEATNMAIEVKKYAIAAGGKVMRDVTLV